MSVHSSFGDGSAVAPRDLSLSDFDGVSLDEPAGPPADEASGARFTLQLLHAADQEAGIPALADAPRFSAVLAALRAQDLDGSGAPFANTLTLSSGDAWIPGVAFSASNEIYGRPGAADVLIQNLLGFQAIAFGNHEFDLGPQLVADLIGGVSFPDGSAFPDFPGTAFPYLGVNLGYDASPLGPLAVDGGAAPQPNTIAPSVVFEIGGEFIGVIGAVTPTLGRISSPGTVEVLPGSGTTEDLAAIIQAEVDLLTGQGINKIVLLAHMQQIAVEYDLAGLLSGVDVIVAGGSNTRLLDDDDRLRDGDSAQGAYPTFLTSASDEPVAVVSTDGTYKYVGRLVIDFDADGVIVPDSYDPAVSGAYATDDAGVDLLGAQDLVDPDIQAIVDALRDVILEQDGDFFGVTTTFLNGDRGSVRAQETNFGNLTADANLAAARAVDDTVLVSIKNGGGIRNSIGEVVTLPGEVEPSFLPPAGNELTGRPEGGISQVAIRNALSFDNGLALLTVTADELVGILEAAVAGAGPGATPGAFPQVSGVRFAFDATLPAGSRVVSAAVVDGDGAVLIPLVRDGAPVAPEGTLIRLVTLDFLALPRFDADGNFTGGGDGYTFPNTNTDPARGEVGDPETLARADFQVLARPGERTGLATFSDDGGEQDALAEYLAANFPAETPFDMADLPPEFDERIQNLAFRADTVFGEPDLTPVVINEFVFDHTGTDTNEYVEIFGAPDTDYSNLWLVLVEGDNVANQGRVIFQSQVGATDADGFWWTGYLPTNSLQNGAQTLLLVSDWTGTATTRLDETRDGAFDATPWTAVLDSVAVSAGNANELTYAPTLLAPGFDGTSFRVAGASRIPDGTDTDAAADWVRNDFSQIGAGPSSAAPGIALNTPGAANAVAEDAPAPQVTLISDIQGAGFVSPMVGERVTVEAVVTQISGALRGLWLQQQEADYDDDPLTSEGIFVFTGNNPLSVQVGDLVRLTGTVGEFFGVTQLSSASDLQVLDRGVDLPAEVVLQLPLPDWMDPAILFESVEGMQVRVVGSDDAPLTVTNTFTRFGEVGVTAGGPLFQPTQIAESFGDAAQAIREANARNYLLFENAVDDGLSSAPRVGDGIAGGAVGGAMHFTFGDYKVETDGPVVFDPSVNPFPRQDAPDDVGGAFKVATLNVLNYFVTLSAADPDARGAATTEQFAAQTAKLVATLAAMDADVVGLVEIENDLSGQPDAATAALVAELNAALGAEVYGFVPTGRIGGDAIKQAYIYKLDTAAPVGEAALLETRAFLDPLNSGRDLSRPALAVTFEELATGERFTAAVNHLKSKGSTTGADFEGEPDDTPDEGSAGLTRLFASIELSDWLLSDPTGAGDPDFLILGDLNAYAMERAIKALEAEGWTDLARAFAADGSDPFSYQFQGRLGTLDYAMANAALLDQVTGATIWNVNSPEAYSIQYDGIDFAAFGDLSAFAGSDHDPVIVGLDLRSAPDPIAIVGTERGDRLTGTEADEFFFLKGGNDVIVTGEGDDVVFLGDILGNGRRETIQIRDFDAEFDALDLGGFAVASAIETPAQVLLTLSGDGDRVILRGVSSLDDVTLLNADLLIA